MSRTVTEPRLSSWPLTLQTLGPARLRQLLVRNLSLCLLSCLSVRPLGPVSLDSPTNRHHPFQPSLNFIFYPFHSAALDPDPSPHRGREERVEGKRCQIVEPLTSQRAPRSTGTGLRQLSHSASMFWLFALWTPVLQITEHILSLNTCERLAVC